MITQPSKRSSARVTALHVTILLLAAWLVYVNAIGNDYTNWDDPEVILNNPHIRTLDADHVRRIFTPGEEGTSGIRGIYRPIWTLSYALDNRVGGLNPAAVHAHSLLLHSLNATLVYLLALAVGLASAPAFAAALVFAVHPIHVEAVAWASGRNEVLVTLFFLAAYLLAAFRTRLAGRFHPGLYAVSLALLALALLSKVTAAVFPFLLFATYAWFLRNRERDSVCRGACVARHLPYLLLSLGLAWIELFVSRAGVVVHPENAASRAVTLLTMPKVVLSYLGSLMLPLHLAPRYDTAYVTGASAEAVATILGLVLVILFSVWIGRRWRAFGFAALWFALTLLPAGNLVLLSTLRADRFMYLPSVGFCLALGALFQISREKNRSLGRIVAMVLAGWCVFCAGVTIGQNRIWKNSVALWETTATRSPGDYMAHHNLGIAYIEAGRREIARLAFERSLELNPDFSKTHNNLGRMSAAAGETEQAERYFRKAIEIDPAYANAFTGLGALYAQTKRDKEAVLALEQSIALDPTQGEPHFLLGQIYARTGNPARAREELTRALASGLAPASTLRAEALLRSSAASDRSDPIAPE